MPPYEHGRTAPFCWGAGTSSGTVRYKAAVPTPHGVVGGGFSVSPEPRTNYRPTRRAGPMCPAAPYRVALIGAWVRMRNRFVGRGILDASMAHSIRGRQGCRPLRFGWPVARTGGGTHRCRPTNMDGLPRFAGGRVRHRTRYDIRPPSQPHTGWWAAAFPFPPNHEQATVPLVGRDLCVPPCRTGWH